MRRALVLVLAVIAGASCQKHVQRTPEVSGLSAVPASAQVLIAADVGRIIDSPLVARAVDQLLLRDSDLATRWQRLRDTCKLDVANIKEVLLVIGPHAGNAPGTGPVLMIATGKVAEDDLASCVRSMVGQGGGSLTAKDAAGHTLYQAKDGNRTMFFAFARPDTVVLGSNEEYVVEALGTGKKATDNSELSKWIKLVDQKAPVWAAGRVDERVRGGLVKVTNGQLKAGPIAMVVSLDPSHGAKLQVGAVMQSAADAMTLESFAKTQLGLLAMAAQAKSMGKVVDKVSISSQGDLVQFKAELGTEDVNLLISALDGGGTAAQDSPPAPGSGSAAGPQR